MLSEMVLQTKLLLVQLRRIAQRTAGESGSTWTSRLPVTVGESAGSRLGAFLTYYNDHDNLAVDPANVQ